VPKRVRDILAIPREKRSPHQIAAVFSYWRTLQPEFAETNDRIEKLWAQWPEGETQLTLMARDEPRETRLLKRGDFLKPANVSKRARPRFCIRFPPTPTARASRLRNGSRTTNSPTTARSFVNRVWQSYFGTGLLGNVGRFRHTRGIAVASRTARLARAEFMDSGWSIKVKLHRLIVNSSLPTANPPASRQPELYERDLTIACSRAARVSASKAKSSATSRSPAAAC
jgi:hypothetical protein